MPTHLSGFEKVTRRSWLTRFSWWLAAALPLSRVTLAAHGTAKQPRSAAKAGKYLETLSWKEAEAALREAKVVLLPLGARSKEHGLHLPLNNDWIMAEYLAARVLDELPVVALPTLPYGYYPAFLEYPGSISIGRDTFRDYVADVCRSICAHGPKKIYILNTGISTNRSLEPARQLLIKDGILMEYTDLTHATEEAQKKVRKEPVGTHADEIETSMMLYMAPEIVRLQLAQPELHESRPGPLTRDPHNTQGVYTPTGAWGDPTLATKEKGKILAEALVAHIVDSIKKMSADDFAGAPPRKQYL